jgi:RNA polymerase sigma-70 factor (family 1)
LHHDENIQEEAKLILLLSQDSEYAFQLLYDRHRNRIYQTAVRYLKSPLLAQEVVQDVFLKLWFERRNMKIGQPLEAWLYTVAKNNLLNRLKKIANEWKALNYLKSVPRETGSQASDKLQDTEYNKLLINALAELSEQQQKVFQLARQENLTYAEIGERLGISPMTVKTHMSRALDHIKTYFSRYGETFLVCLMIPTVYFS